MSQLRVVRLVADGLPRIESIFAWICTDKADGTEGVPAVGMAGGMVVPLYSSRKEIALKMRPAAEEMARQGNKMALVEFAYRIPLEVIEAS